MHMRSMKDRNQLLNATIVAPFARIVWGAEIDNAGLYSATDFTTVEIMER